MIAPAQKPALPHEAYRWHAKPKHGSKKKCPICGYSSKRVGVHRAADPHQAGLAKWFHRKTTLEGHIIEEPILNRGRPLFTKRPIAAPVDHTGPLSIDAILDRYRLFTPLAAGTVQQRQITIKLFSRFLGRPATVADLARETVSAWLAWLATSRGATTVQAKRSAIMALWRFAFDEGLCTDEPRGVRSIKVPSRDPEAPGRDDVAKIINACRDHGGRHAAALVATYWLCWETCCRISAVYNAKPEDFDQRDGKVRLFESKTGQHRLFPLCEEARAALDALPKNRRRLCGATIVVKRFRDALTHVLEAAGLPADHRSKFQRIRRAKYTAVAVRFGLVAAARHAGHKSTAMARYYLDSSHAADEQQIALIGLPGEILNGGTAGPKSDLLRAAFPLI